MNHEPYDPIKWLQEDIAYFFRDPVFAWSFILFFAAGLLACLWLLSANNAPRARR